MIKFVVLICLIGYVSCESVITTLAPNYIVDQLDDGSSPSIDQIEAKKTVTEEPSVTYDITENVILPANEISSNEKVEIAPKAGESTQELIIMEPKINDNLASKDESVKKETNTEMTTIMPEVIRIKRAPRYTVGQILAPNGIMHEIGHLRDHAVNSVAKRTGNTRLERISKARTEIHHKSHHIPNHLAYLPVIGPLLDERRPRLFARRSPGLLGRPGGILSRIRRARAMRGGSLFSRIRRARAMRGGSLFSRIRRARAMRGGSLFSRIRRARALRRAGLLRRRSLFRRVL